MTTPAKTPIYKDPSCPAIQRVEDLLERMTLDEKVAQLGSAWIFLLAAEGKEPALDPNKAGYLLSKGIGQITRIGGGSVYTPRQNAQMANQIQDYLISHTRLGIPAMVHEECCSGFLAVGATRYPQIIGLASTWQPELAEAMTAQIRQQMRAVGAHQGLAPVLDVARDARWGRVEETFGEDPTLVAQMGIAYIRGLQGEDPRQGIMATGKHFVGHSYSEGAMNCAPVHLGWRDLYDIWLVPFAAAIHEAGLATIMNAYPDLDGEVVASSKAILTDLLHNKLGFDGLVVSDYEAVAMIHNYHHAAKDEAEAAVMALNAGIDIELPMTRCYGQPLIEAVQQRKIGEDIIDRSVRRILQAKISLGLFENPFVDVDQVEQFYDLAEQQELANKIARQSIVLLKNDHQTLPLSKEVKCLAVIGPNADSVRNLLGDYSYQASYELSTQVSSGFLAGQDPVKASQESANGMVGLRTILDEIKGMVSPRTKVLYAQGCEVNSEKRDKFADAVRVAEEAEVVVMVLGEKAGLTPDCTSGETRDQADLRLPGVQEELVKAVAAVGKPVTAVLVNGRPLSITWLVENVPAIVEAWFPAEGSRAVAEVLFGEVNPGGKLPMTFPRSVGQVPIFYNHKSSGGRSNWYSDYVSESSKPLYPFGHGLSFTSFEYSDLNVEPAKVEAGGRVKISLQVKNTGERDGEEVVQLYVFDETASIPRPVKELKGFVRLGLAAGEARKVVFDLAVNQLGFHDVDMNLVVEGGTVQVMAGSSSEDIRLNGAFDILGEGKHSVPKRVFTCPVHVL